MLGAMTEGRESRQILLFTLPLIGGNLLQQLYSVVDGMVVGNFVSEDALSSVGTCSPLILLLIALAFGMSTGCSVVAAQYFGAKEYDALRRAVSTALLLMTGLGLALTVLGILFSRPLLAGLLGAPEESLDRALLYFRICCLGQVFQFIYNITAATLRAVGDSRATLYFLLVASVANVVLDLLFVAVFRWDVAGAAAATVLAQALSAVVSVRYMYRRHPLLRFTRAQLVWDGEMARLNLKIGVPSALQQSVISFGHLGLQRVINSFGPALMGAFMAGMRLDSIIMLVPQSFCAGLSAFTGQNLGAGRLDRVLRGQRAGMVLSVCICAVLSALYWLCAGPLMAAFGLTGEGLALGISYAHFTAPMMLIYAVYMSFAGVLRGAGDMVASVGITLSSQVVRIGAAYVLVLCTPIGPEVAWLTMPFDFVTALVVGYLRYKFGPWRQMGIVKRSKVQPNGE